MRSLPYVTQLAPCAWLLLSAAPAWAIQDTNSNGLSDVWERKFNAGSLFSASTPDHAATADPDKDGWTNAMEALAGTDPFKATAPTGHLNPTIARNPPPSGPLQISWPSTQGKVYQLLTSTDLANWSPSGSPVSGTGAVLQLSLGAPGVGKRYWRLKITDAIGDPDGDTLNAWEEFTLGTDPALADTDGDNIPDNLDPYPTISSALTDPDGTNVATSIATNLQGFWDFESIQGSTYANRSGSSFPATSFSGGPVRFGMPSQATRIGGTGYLTVPPAILQNKTSWSVSGWFKLGKDSIKNANVVYRAIFSMYDLQGTGPAPQLATLAQGTCLLVRHANTLQEQWFVGGYRQFASDGSNGATVGDPVTEFTNTTFERNLGTSDDGKWHQFTVTCASSQTNGLKLYLDGVLVYQVAYQPYPLAYDASTTFTFGRLYPAHTSSALPDAQLDRLRVHARVLTSTEVQGLVHQDIDGDGLWDITESRTVNWVDANSNTVVDPGEYTYVTSPYVSQSSALDHDNDGLTDLEEQTAGTDLTKADTDGDLMPDGWEVDNGLNPLSPADATLDPDVDGKTNLYEYQHGTNPHVFN